MIKYNSNTINDWYYNSSDIIKVYHNGAVCYYKIAENGSYKVCFAVVDDITQYSDREFEDVYDKATEKWYKLNNLNQYEEYGVYASGRTICEGSTSRLPQGYTEVEYIENTASGSNTSSTSRLAVKFEDSITNNESAYTYEITCELNVGNTSAYWDFCGNPYVQLQRADSGYGNMFEPRAWGKRFSSNVAGTFISDIKYKIRIFQGVSDAYPILEITNITAETTNSYSMTATRSNMLNNSVKFGLFSFYNVSDSGAKTVPAKIYELKIYDRENNLLAHAVPCKRDIDGKVGFYNLARDEFEYDASGELTLIAGEPVTPTDCVTTYEGKLTIDEEVSPLPYTELEWIEMPQTEPYCAVQLVDTYSAATNLYYDFKLLFNNLSDLRILGFANNSHLIGYHNNTIYLDINGSRKFTSNGFTTNTEYHFGLGYKNNSYVFENIDSSTTYATFNAPLPKSSKPYFGAVTINGTIYVNGESERIYSVKVYDDGVLVGDYIPVKRNSDDFVTLYDLISEQYCNTTGGGTMVAGPTVTPTSTTCEFIYSGDSWVNVGEVSGSSRLPAGYTEVEYVENTNRAYIDSNFVPNQDTRIVADMQLVTQNNYGRLFGAGAWNASDGLNLNYEGGYLRVAWFGKTTWTIYYSIPTNFNRHTYDLNKNSLYVDESLIGSNTYTTKTASDNLGLFCFIKNGNPPTDAAECFLGKLYSCQVYDNGTLVRDLVPCKNSSNVAGVYDIINDVFYSSPNTYQLNAGSSVAPPIVLPINYDEKSDPLDNLSFSSMTEAETYAYNNCVYDGLRATIDGELYTFDSEEGWVEIPYYYKFEDVTPSSASGWTITESQTYNPDSTYYDDYSLENSTTSNVSKIAKITIYGYESFTYYIRSFGYSTYVYVTSSNVDEIQTDPTTHIGYNSTSAITNTYYFNKNAGSSVNLSNYRRITYNNLDKNVEHTFYVTFYGRSYSSYYANATILIPKEQTNENWEQVTFTSSSNVSGNPKNLYVDGNYSSSGGTQFFCYRWMLGLPSGSHSSNVSYTNYNYCPDVTSSTFTSVAGNSRLVEYSYNGTTNKTLQFRLVDESGNTINTADTVYYSMTYYNSCGASSSSSNLTFPRGISVKVGGRFNFTSSSNRHYIYGYEPNIQLNTSYYSDNYETYFDIPYTKLSTEAVTVTYVTYDPNDVEVPAFSTKISYPYGNSGTTTNTLTSYDVPYTYTYDVAQTNNKFSADSQSFTASGASRTITFTLYPNNRDFSTVADLEAYQYAWEGMKANVDGTAYTYENGEWAENQYVVPSGYTELEYCIVPRVKPTTLFTVPYECQPNYKYTTEFTPLNFWSTSYYGGIAGYNDSNNKDFEYFIFKLDNGWGDQFNRFVIKFQNYEWDTRNSGTVPRAFTFYENVRAKITLHLNNYSAGQGAVLTIENEGYSTYSNTRTKVIDSSWQITYGVKDLNLLNDNSTNDFCANMNFHNFKVEDTQGNLIYDYRPVTRLSDNKVGLYDVVNQQFFYPTGFTLTAGPSV